jgi:hypothetical protein
MARFRAWAGPTQTVRTERNHFTDNGTRDRSPELRPGQVQSLAPYASVVLHSIIGVHSVDVKWQNRRLRDRMFAGFSPPPSWPLPVGIDWLVKKLAAVNAGRSDAASG